MTIDLRALVGKLNPLCKIGLESAAVFCVAETHQSVEIEHLLLKLLETPDTDLQRILRHYQVDASEVSRELGRAVARFARGSAQTPTLSGKLIQLLQGALMLSSRRLGACEVRSGSLLLALFEEESLQAVVLDSAPALLRIPTDRLLEDLRTVIRGSLEDTPSGKASGSRGSEPQTLLGSGRPDASTPALDQYTIDLTAEARAGRLDPIQGRDAEIRQVIDVLMRRRQNNPILTGEAGVGKTAVVEAFARRVASGTVPPCLQQVSVRLLDLALLQAGAGIKGEFEQRLKTVIAEVKGSSRPIILFIDEAHTLIGTGGPPGQGDAANLLKPALARGEVRTIAATTWGEYKKYFEKDPALARRFQVIKVEEPDEATAVTMLRAVVANLERHHHVRILDEAVREAVRLSHRYISERHLPDKAISVLDTASARVAMAQHATPAALDDAVRHIERLKVELDILNHEGTSDGAHPERHAELTTGLEKARALHKQLEVRWEKERSLAEAIRKLQKEVGSRAAASGAHGRDGRGLELVRLQGELAKIQGEVPMVPVSVDMRSVASVVSDWTGVPVGKLLQDEVHLLLGLKDRLMERIVGQPEAVDAISRRITTFRANLEDPDKPLGVFLLVGPSGVGKTETAAALADLLYGGERNLVVVNMSEYQEAYTVSTLKGSPPGYLGHGKGGVLTEAVRRHPFSVVLLDEIEKAHPDVLELFYPVFDKGTLEDSEGLAVNFRNTVILLTSHVGTEAITKASRGSAKRPDAGALAELLKSELLAHFPSALLGRLVIVPFYPLGSGEIRWIVERKLAKVRRRFQDVHRAELTYADELVETIAARCVGADAGARSVDHVLTKTLLPDLACEVLGYMARGARCAKVHVAPDPNGGYTYVAGSTAVAIPSQGGALSDAERRDAGEAPIGRQPWTLRVSISGWHAVRRVGRSGTVLGRRAVQVGLAGWKRGQPTCSAFVRGLAFRLHRAFSWCWRQVMTSSRRGARLSVSALRRGWQLGFSHWGPTKANSGSRAQEGPLHGQK